MNAKPAARFAFRWMMAVETGDKSWHTLDAPIVDELMWREFGHDDFAEILSQCRQWVPTLFDGDTEEVVDWEAEENAATSKSGTIVTVGHRAPCNRCGGEGGWQGWPGFTCYRCGGQGSRRFEYISRKAYTKKGLERLQASRRRAQEKREAKAAQERQERREAFQAWVEQDGSRRDLVARLEAYEGRSQFLEDMARRTRAHRLLTDRQVEAAISALAAELERKQEMEQSQHIGDVGERLKSLVVRVLFVKEIDGQFGTSLLVGMADSQGNQLRTFSTSKWVWAVKPGDTLTIDATVKKHETYQGTMQTILTRTSKV